MHPIVSTLPAGLAILGCLMAVPSQTHAAESYDNCAGFIDTAPAVIATQGTWCLRQNLSTAMTSGNAIEITTNNVTIDCNHFKIGGLAAGSGTMAVGILINGRFNTTVRHCNIRGFYAGISADNGGGHLVERNTSDNNTVIGIAVTFSPGSTIRGNLIRDTGGSTEVETVAYGIYSSNGVDVIDNTVNGVAAIGANADAYGIIAYNNGKGSTTGNRVRGLASMGTGTAFGIFNFAATRTVVRDNVVQGSGGVGSIGVHCASNHATARDNVITGFSTGVENCWSSGNTVNPN